MKRDLLKNKHELLKLIHLKRDVLSTEILQLQAEKNELEDKKNFYARLGNEWIAEGSFQNASRVTGRIGAVNAQVENANQDIEIAQRERLKLLLSIRALSQ